MKKYLVTIFNVKNGSILVEYKVLSKNSRAAIANVLINYRYDDVVANMHDEDVIQAQVIEGKDE